MTLLAWLAWGEWRAQPVRNALSVYEVFDDVLERLQPTHIITQSQCEVCAVSLKDVEQAVCELTSSKPVIVSLEPNSLDDVWADILRVGEALGERRQSGVHACVF